MIEKYGWWEKETRPYPNCPMTAREIINECKDYDKCTAGSKSYLKSLANGFIDILESWEKYELTPKIKVRIKKSGYIREITADMIELLGDIVEII